MFKRTVPLVLIILFVGIVFFQAVRFEFINFDDNLYLTANPEVGRGLTLGGIQWAFTTSFGGHWHPLSWIVHMIIVSFWGLNPAAHHLVNIIFHGANALLVFALYRTIGLNRFIATVSAVIWAIHPLRMESVVWASQLKEVLSEFFALLAINYSQRFKAQDRYPQRFLIGVLFVLGLLAKPTIITLPALLVLIDLWQFKQDWSYAAVFRALRSQVYLLLIALGFTGIFIYSQKTGGGLRSLDEVPGFERLTIVPLSMMVYFVKFFTPINLIPFYPRTALPAGILSVTFFGFLLLLTFCWAQRGKLPGVFFGTIWLLIAALPMSGFLAVGGQLYADRWTYLAHVGFVFGLAYEIQRRFSPQVARFVTCGALAIFVAISLKLIVHWRSSIELFKYTVEVDSQNFMAQNNLASAFIDRGDISAAALPAAEAVRLNPTYPEALNNLGVVKASQGEVREARELFLKALDRRPDFLQARNNLAIAERQLGIR